VATTPTDFQAWMLDRQDRIERTLHALLPAPEFAPTRLHAAMRYAVLGGGKRVRPLLAYGAGELARADVQAVDRVAAAVEMIHAYSLVRRPPGHDDILWRGKPTVYRVRRTALLVGDSLQSLAFQVLSERKLADRAEHQLAMIELLARASGSRGMAGGQATDLEATGKTLTVPELEFMLFRARADPARWSSARAAAAALSNPSSVTSCFGSIGSRSRWTTSCAHPAPHAQQTAGKDAGNNKPTYVSADWSVREGSRGNCATTP
jgi:farnesyl diphosphate synthase